MKRLCVFCFYDKDGVFYNSDRYLVKELRSISDYLIVVVNGDISADGISFVKECAEDVVLRENSGFDVCAYKAAFEKIGYGFSKYDELVLCNNSFFGPFVPFSKIFDKMQSSQCDFWGLKLQDLKLYKFIESYFLVFRKSLLSTNAISDYFKHKVGDVNSYSDCCFVFEYGLFKWLTDNGFSYSCYATPTNYNAVFCGDNEIINAELPIAKRKFFTEYDENKKNIIAALHFIDKNFDYDISYILEKIARIQGCPETRNLKGIVSLSADELKAFAKNREFYVYGTGMYAKIVAGLLLKDDSLCRGFIQSDEFFVENQSFCSLPVVRLSDISDKSALIIIAMTKENTAQVLPLLAEYKNVVNLWEPLPASNPQSFVL